MIKVRQIKIDVKEYSFDNLYNKVIKKLGIKSSDVINFKINKRSIDARDKSFVYYVFEVLVELVSYDFIRFSNDIAWYDDVSYSFSNIGSSKINERIVVVGSGPCGLFCAYKLAQYGYKPLIIERGEQTNDRILSVEKFWNTGILNKESNVVFGEGGAGTFSDGKLNTLVKDKRNLMSEVFKIFVENGAPQEITYIKNPHIGTDLLRNIIVNMRNKIIEMGGEFRFSTKLTDINISNNEVVSITVNDNEVIPCSILVLAIGHSATDTIKMLYNKGMNMSNKPFAVGLRVMHDQELINKNQYGDYSVYLEPASYKLTHVTPDNHGVYSFCMCPGGYVVNSSSFDGKLVINGMSNYKRDSGVANSAIVVSVSEKDYGNNLFDGLKFQQSLEEKAYRIGNGSIPVQRYIDFKNNIYNDNYKVNDSVIKGSYSYANLRELFPSYIVNNFISGMEYFNRKIPGFSNDDVLLLGVESRTSSSIRIKRNEEYESNISGIYPAGEGAGYAGGITTSAIDGILVFESIASKYKPL